MTTPATPQRENKTLAQAIDEAMLNTRTYATELQVWLTDSRGPYMPIYIEFYRYFNILVELTSPLTEMKPDEKLIEECLAWIEPVKMRSPPQEADLARIEKGIKLYRQYYQKLNFRGIITLRK